LALRLAATVASRTFPEIAAALPAAVSGRWVIIELAASAEHRLRRSDLPTRHTERFAGDPNDEFRLTISNELRRA
jgi:hypothetical protein